MTFTEPARTPPDRAVVLRIEDVGALGPATAAEVAALLSRVVRLVPQARLVSGAAAVHDDLALPRARRIEAEPLAPHPLLTAQEHRVASLAASGLSNKQIGVRLHLSPRTVSGHLYRIFPKLGVTSRAALRDALLGLDAEERTG